MWFLLILGLKLIVYPILTLILLGALKDLTFFAKSWRYLFQDIKLKYIPVVGFGLFVKAKKSQNELENYLKFFQDKESDSGGSLDIILTNNPTATSPTIFINEKRLLKQFYMAETEVSYKTDFSGFPVKHSFIYQKGKKALADRAIFAEIFFSGNMRKIAPGIYKIIEKYVEKIKERVKSSPDRYFLAQKNGSGSKFEKKSKFERVEKFKKNQEKTEKNDLNGALELDLKDYSLSIITEIAGLVLFGEEVPKVNGVELTELIIKSITNVISTSGKLPNLLTMKMYRRLGFQPEFNEAMRLKEIINKKLSETVLRRTNSKTYQRGVNVIDLILNKNDELEAEGRSQERLSPLEIIHNIYILIFAGVDTTKNTTESCLYQLSRRAGLQARLRVHLSEKLFGNGLERNYDSYDDCELLGGFLKENLRLYSPAWTGFPRIVTKDFNLGKYRIYKGTSIFIPYSVIHQKPEYYNEPGTFDEGRFERVDDLKRFSKHGFQPFGLGRRACIGKNLAQISIHMIMACFLKHFEMLPGSAESRFLVHGTYGLEHCRVRLRPF